MIKINLGFMTGAHAVIKITGGVRDYKGMMIGAIRLPYLQMAGTAASELEQLWRIAAAAIDICH